MAIDAFVSVKPLALPFNSTTFFNTLTLVFDVGNNGDTTAFDATLIKTLFFPFGTTTIISDDGGAIVVPHLFGNIINVIDFVAVSFIYPNLTLPAVSGSMVTIKRFSVTLQVYTDFHPIGILNPVHSFPSTNMRDITQVIAAGDINPDNNLAIRELFIRDLGFSPIRVP
jgi:hypothetical protein